MNPAVDPAVTAVTAMAPNVSTVSSPGPAAGFEVRPAALHGAAGVLGAESDALHEATATLQTRLEGIGACWGDDAVGERFAVRYRPAAQTVLTNLGALSSGLGHIAAALRAVADNYQRADQAAAAIDTTTIDTTTIDTTSMGTAAMVDTGSTDTTMLGTAAIRAVATAAAAIGATS